MASISGANSLGNTAIRGYGGFASGIDRDSVIEQMTLGTQTKIKNHKNSMTRISWKQESYQSMSTKMLELQDKYFSFSSGINLKYASAFAKNKISPVGDPDVTKYLSATGTSDMLDYLSILGVKQKATSATTQSGVKGVDSIKTNITGSSLNDTVYKSSRLQGTQLRFGTYDAGGSFTSAGTFTFPTTYERLKADGVTKENVSIDYTQDPTLPNTSTDPEYAGLATNGDVLAYQLNKALEQSGIKSGTDKISDVMEFRFDGTSMKLNMKTGMSTGLVINSSSSALSALGYNSVKADGANKDESDGITLAEFNDNQKVFTDTYINTQNMVQYLTGKKFTISIGGQSKQIELVKSGDSFANLDQMKAKIQERLDQEFGTNKIKVSGGTQTDGSVDPLEFESVNPSQSLTISSDSKEVRDTLGIVKGASTKISMDGSLQDNASKLGLTASDLTTPMSLKINGVDIAISPTDSINEIIDKINNNKDCGVKAKYLSNDNQFVLVAKESGSGRDIQLSGLAEKIFGATKDSMGNITSGQETSGDDAEILVSYGNGVKTLITSSSNTFDLDGLKVTVNNTFGDVTEIKDSMGNVTGYNSDPSQAVTFSAKADAEGMTEKIKEFIEAYNEMVKEINAQKRTKPNDSYGPLTEEQKSEMSEKSIENWEKKAKEGLLFSDSIVRDLSTDIQNVLTTLTSGGVTYEDLKEIGISFSDDLTDGGTFTFDETAFKNIMETDPEKAANIFSGGGNVEKGLAQIIEDTLTPYATRYASRNGGSNGRLIDEAGSELMPSSLTSNHIYKELEEKQKQLERLQERLSMEQDRYVRQFTTMETLISQMNSQSGWLANMQG